MPRPRTARCGDPGFTLIEVMVVLAIIAAIGGVAYAYLPPLTARVRLAFERDDFERQLLELPQRVRLSGRGGVLTSRSGDDLPDGTPIAVEDLAKAGNALEAWQVLRLDLPRGWRVEVPQPVFYHFSGACDGGRVAFLSPPAALTYILTAPLCRPVRDDAAAPE